MYMVRYSPAAVYTCSSTPDATRGRTSTTSSNFSPRLNVSSEWDRWKEKFKQSLLYNPLVFWTSPLTSVTWNISLPFGPMRYVHEWNLAGHSRVWNCSVLIQTAAARLPRVLGLQLSSVPSNFPPGPIFTTAALGILYSSILTTVSLLHCLCGDWWAAQRFCLLSRGNIKWRVI